MASKKRRPQKDSPDLIKARSSWERGRYSEALHRFDKALRRQPNHPMALIDAARAFGSRFQTNKAQRILAHLEKLAGSRAGELVEAAQAYLIANRPEEAARCLEKVIGRHPDQADANRELAALLESRHQLDRAREHIERSLRTDPDSPEALLIQARIMIGLGDPDFAYAILVDLTQPGKKPLLRAEAHSLLAHIQELEGDYGEAFETMMAGNAVLERLSASARDAAESLEPVLVHLRDSVETDHLRRWMKLKESAEEEALPMALMAGPYRAGSSLFGRMLAAHPEIAVSDDVPAFAEEIFPAALNAGADDANSKSSELFRTMLQAQRQQESVRYRQLLLENHHQHHGSHPPPGRLIDRSPGIASLVPSFLRIVPSGKLIIPVRDPRDLLVSCLFSYLPVNRYTVGFLHPFDAAERIAFELETWVKFRKMLIPAQWIEVRYEDVVHNFTNEARRACRLLDVAWDPSIEQYRESACQAPTTAPLQNQITRPLHDRSVGRWKHYESQLGSYYDELAGVIELLDY